MNLPDIDLRPLLASARQAWTIPGVSVAVVTSDAEQVLVHHGYAELESRTPVEDSTVFQIGSISKSFTGAVLAELAERHEVELSDPVTRFLPWFRVGSTASSITLGHLLNHTAGLVTCLDSIPDAAAQAAATRFTDVGCAPGEWFHYSNVGYAILGLVAEAVTGVPIGEAARELLLGPLGMDRSSGEMPHEARLRLATGYVPLFDDRPFLPDDPLIPAPWFEFADGSGNVAATAHDLGRYARMLLGRGGFEGRRILSEGGFERIVGQVAVTETDGRPERYGLGLSIDHDSDGLVLSHAGGMVGYSAYLIAHVGLDVGVVVLTNAPGEFGVAGLVAHRVLAAVRSGSVAEQLVPDRRAIEEPDRYVGSFAAGASAISVSRAPGGRLRLLSGDASGELYETGAGWLACDHPELRTAQHRVQDHAGVRCWTYGPLRLSESGAEVPATPAEGSVHPLVGLYRSYSPWFPSFRIVQRGSDLVLLASVGVEAPQEEQLLVRIGEGHYRVGADPRLPERLVCGPLVDDRVVWVDRDLCRYTRSFRD